MIGDRHVGLPLEDGAIIHKWLALVTSQFIDSGNNIRCNREAVLGAAVATTTGVKIHEVVRTL